jgi:hypothetical protein
MPSFHHFVNIIFHYHYIVINITLLNISFSPAFAIAALPPFSPRIFSLFCHTYVIIELTYASYWPRRRHSRQPFLLFFTPPLPPRHMPLPLIAYATPRSLLLPPFFASYAFC